MFPLQLLVLLSTGALGNGQTNDDRTRSDYYAQVTSGTEKNCDYGILFANNEDCGSYYECVDGRYELRYCPQGYLFDPSKNCCRLNYYCPKRLQTEETTESPFSFSPSSEPSSLALSPSSECRKGEMKVDEHSCNRYYVCVVDTHAHFEQRTCQSGTFFDSRKKQCMPIAQTESKCAAASRDYVGGDRNWQSRPQRPPYGGIAEQQYGTDQYGQECVESGGPSGYKADPTNCHKFYQCANGRWVQMSCPSNLAWNSAITVCDWPNNVSPPCVP